MKKIILLSVAVLAILASCKKENQNAPLTLEEQLGFEIKSTFEATIVNDAANVNAPKDGMSTTAHLGDQNFVYWDKNDKISINGLEHTTDFTGSGDNMTVYFYGPTEVPTDTNGKFHAFYPSGIQNTSANNYNKGRLPAYQTFSYEGTISLPMYAVSEGYFLEFHNICSILEITIPAGIEANKIEITADEWLAGSFEIDANGVLNMTETDSSYKKLTIDAGSTPWHSGDEVKCAIPGRTQNTSNDTAYGNYYHNMKITIFKTDGSTMVRSKAQFKVKPSNIYKMTIGLKAKAADAFVKAGSNMAAFSVSDTQQVYFTSGNLVAVNDGNTYISPCQTDYPNVYEAGHVAHYYWQTSLADAAKEARGGAGKKTNLFCCANGYQVKDFNGNIIQSGNLRLLSNQEWAYLLGVNIYGGASHSSPNYNGENQAYHRTNATTLRAFATVEGTKCLVVAPDGGPSPTANGTYTLAQIANLGYLCLPLGGYRIEKKITTTDYTSDNKANYDYCVRYWTSTNADDGSNSYSIVVRDNKQTKAENDLRFWISIEPQNTARLIRLAINTGDYQ